jgi:hypothetical protein
MKEAFTEHRFTAVTLKRIELANSILEGLARQGYMISLRQLYYQLVAKGAIPNSQKEYKKLGDTLNKARLAGLVDWATLEDRGRGLKGGDNGYDDPAHFVANAGDGYYIKWWEGQDNYVEVWVEKDALVGVVQRPCDRYRVPFFSCRGYSSASEQYAAGKRFARQDHDGRTCHILHLGDHDPSGLDMTRDNEEKAIMFSGVEVLVHRIALNMPQVEELRPPPNPAKMTDSRVGNYIANYGRKSWELDALPPAYLDNLIDTHIRELIDTDKMDDRKAQEARDAEDMQKFFGSISDNYEDVRQYLIDNDLL